MSIVESSGRDCKALTDEGQPFYVKFCTRCRQAPRYGLSWQDILLINSSAYSITYPARYGNTIFTYHFYDVVDNVTANT